MSELKLQQSRLDGRYDILECLGRGSYAEIYVATDNAAPEGAPQTIVIKALNLYLQDAPDLELERTRDRKSSSYRRAEIPSQRTSQEL